jgi:hypothetical protein
MEVDIYNNKNQTYWTDPEVGQFGAQATSAYGYVSFYPPTPFGGVRYIQPPQRPQVFYWSPPQQQPKVIEPAPKTVTPEPVTSYLFYEVFAFIVTVFCNCVFGTIAWVLARK